MVKNTMNKKRGGKQLAVLTEKDLKKLPSQISEIFIGDEQFIHKTFWGILKNNKFSSIKRLPAQHIKMIADDIFQTALIRIWVLYSDRSLKTIKNKKAYIRQIIRFKIIDTDRRLGRLVSYDDIIHKNGGF